jgi:hypothetical protein
VPVVSLAELAWEGLPAGPLSGAEATVWKSRTGTLLHGSRNCAALTRSTPTPRHHPLGSADTLGALDWPDELHCRVEFPDSDLERYHAETYVVAADRSRANAVLQALGAAVSDGYGWPRDDVGTWDWPTLARLAVTVAPGIAPHRERFYGPAVTSDALVPLHQQTRNALEDAAERLGAVFSNRDWRQSAAATGRHQLYRVCAALLIDSQYHHRDGGLWWKQFREVGWRAASSTVRAFDPDAANRHHDYMGVAAATLFGGEPADMRQADAAFAMDVLEPLRDALLGHGQESWTYHRLHAVAHEAAAPWTDTFTRWLEGAHFGWGGLDAQMRSRLVAGGRGPRVLAAIAAAEAAWQAYLDGLAANPGTTHVVVLRANGSGPFNADWLLAAMALSHPTVQVLDDADTTKPETPSARWYVTALPEMAVTVLNEGAVLAAQPVVHPVTNQDLAVYATAINQLPSQALAGDLRKAIRDADGDRRNGEPQ